MEGGLIKVPSKELSKYLKPVETRTDIAKLTYELADQLFISRCSVGKIVLLLD